LNKIILLFLLILLFVGSRTGICAEADEKGGSMEMKLTSPSFKNNDKMPVKFTFDGKDINPALKIENLPAGTKSLALIVDDPDAPMKVWVHWVVYDIPPSDHIDEASIPGKQGINDSGGKDYHGPCPPSGTHRYFFKVYALDKILGLDEGISKGDIEKAMRGSILSSAELVGLYNREQGKR